MSLLWYQELLSAEIRLLSCAGDAVGRGHRSNWQPFCEWRLWCCPWKLVLWCIGDFGDDVMVLWVIFGDYGNLL